MFCLFCVKGKDTIIKEKRNKPQSRQLARERSWRRRIKSRALGLGSGQAAAWPEGKGAVASRNCEKTQSIRKSEPRLSTLNLPWLICPSSNPNCTQEAVSHSQVQNPPSYCCWNDLSSTVHDTHSLSSLGVLQNPSCSLAVPYLSSVCLRGPPTPPQSGSITGRGIILKAHMPSSSNCFLALAGQLLP